MPLLFSSGGRRAACQGALLALACAVVCTDACALQAPSEARAPAQPGVVPLEDPTRPLIPFASAHAAAVTTPSRPQAFGGARTGTEPTLSERVVAYQLEATLDPVKHTVLGRERLTWRNRSDQEVRSVFLHLYLNAFEGNASTFALESHRAGFGFRSEVQTKPGEWGHIELRSATQAGKVANWTFVHPDGGPDTDHTVVRIDLPEPVAAGASTMLDISFMDQLPRVVARTGYFGTFHLVGQWFPKIGVLELPGERGATQTRWNVHEFHLNSEFYADYGSFDALLTVPKGFTVGATGEEVEAPLEKGSLVTHHFVQDDVHEFAWTADSRTAKPLVGSYEGPGSPKVKVTVLYPEEYASNAEPVLKATIDAIGYFSRTLGPYPYKTVTAVIPPHNAAEAGGMEYPTFFTTESDSDVQPDTMGRQSLDFTTIHEFGHGYFYGIIGSNEFEEPMLDEGMNEFWDDRMLRGTPDESQALTTTWLKRFGFSLHMNAWQIARQFALLREPPDPIGANSWDRYSSQSYATVYSRTVVAMHDLEVRLGRPVFEDAMKAYYARWKFRHPSIADLEASLAESSGQREVVHAAFEQEIYNATKIDDAVTDIQTREVLPEPGTQQVAGQWVEQTDDEVENTIGTARKAWREAHPDGPTTTGPFPFQTTVTLRRYGAPVPETLLVRFADGSTETVQWDDTMRWQRYTWIKPVRGVSAELDPMETHLLDANRVNNSLTVVNSSAPPPATAAEGVRRFVERILGAPVSRRWATEFESVCQTVLTLVATL